MIHRLAEEAGAGHCSDAYQPGQILAEFQIAVIAEFGNVQQDIIRPLRIVVDDVQIIQSLEEQLLLVGVFSPLRNSSFLWVYFASRSS